MKRNGLAVILVLACVNLNAAPPPGHPSVDQAHDALSVPDNAALVNKGRVKQSILSNDYVYIEVITDSGSRWLAAPRQELMDQVWISFGNGTVMRNFYSRKHKRTFDEVMFVDRIKVLGN